MLRVIVQLLFISMFVFMGMWLPGKAPHPFGFVSDRPCSLVDGALVSLLKRPFRTAVRSNPSEREAPQKKDEKAEYASSPQSPSSAPPLHHQFDPIIQAAAEEFNVDFFLIKGIIQAESSFNPGAVSPVGASGLMQIMPQTARMLGVENMFDPKENIYAGVRYFKTLLEQLNGNVKLALAAYHAGPTRVRRYRGIPPYRVTRNYIHRVFKYRKEFKVKKL